MRCLICLVLAAVWAQQVLPPAPGTSTETRRASWRQHLEMDEASEFRGLPWRSVGPAFQGGRVEALAVHPSRPDTWFVGAGSGSVWKTTNAGTTWRPVLTHHPTFSIGDIAIAPGNPDVVWIGTGEVLMARSSFAGFGVFKSVDGGSSWQSMGLEATHHIGKVLIDPRSPDIVLVAAIGRNYGTNPERGVFLTTDGGRTWKKTLFVDDRTGAIDLAMHPTDPRKIFAVMWEHDRRAWHHTSAGSGSGLFRSTDGGHTWQRVTQGLPTGPHLGRMGVAFAPSRPEVVYVLVSNETPLPSTPASSASLTAEAAGRLTKDAFLALENAAIESLLRSSGLPRRHTAGAVRQRVAWNANRLLKSVDRGDQWMVVSPDLTTNPKPERRGNVPYGTITSVSESPLRRGLLLIGTDDGKVQYTRDEGRNWTDVTSGLPDRWVSRVVASSLHIKQIDGAGERRIETSGSAGVNEILWDLRLTRANEGGSEPVLRDAPAGTYRVTVEAAGRRAETTLRVVNRSER